MEVMLLFKVSHEWKTNGKLYAKKGKSKVQTTHTTAYIHRKKLHFWQNRTTEKADNLLDIEYMYIFVFK